MLAVEEAVRRPVVDHELVLDSRIGERPLERLVVLGGDVLVGAGLQGENRRLHLRCQLLRAGRAVALTGTAVEADRAGQPVAACRGEP